MKNNEQQKKYCICTRKHRLEDVSLCRLPMKKHLDDDGHHRHSNDDDDDDDNHHETKINKHRTENIVYVIFICEYIQISPGDLRTFHPNPNLHLHINISVYVQRATCLCILNKCM